VQKSKRLEFSADDEVEIDGWDDHGVTFDSPATTNGKNTNISDLQRTGSNKKPKSLLAVKSQSISFNDYEDD
jgi:hypothetical protein